MSSDPCDALPSLMGLMGRYEADVLKFFEMFTRAEMGCKSCEMLSSQKISSLAADCVATGLIMDRADAAAEAFIDARNDSRESSSS